MAASTIETRPASAAPWSVVAALHALALAAIVVVQIVFTPAHDPSADATWHYRLAVDILNGRPIYWFGVDANRFFPDLVFTLLGLVLSGGARFTTWLYFFYTIQFVAAYFAMWGLAATLYRDGRDRVAFCVLGISGLLVLTLASPFWCGWMLEPGGHGTGLSACIALLALVLWANTSERFPWLVAATFVLAATLLIASNRYLVFGFLAPVLLALAAGALARAGYFRMWREGGGLARFAGGPLVTLMACTAFAALAGLLAWKAMDALSWYKMTAGGSLPDFPRSNYGAWISARADKEWTDLMRPDEETRQIRPAVAFLVAMVPLAVFVALRAARTERWSPTSENRMIFAVFTAASVLFALLFVFVMAVESGPYHYRYLTIPLALAIVFGGSLFVPLGRSFGRWRPAATVALLAAVVAFSFVRANARGGTIDSNRSLQNGVGVLERALRPHSSAPVMRGFAEYWEAHDLTVRSDRVHLATVEVDRMQFGLYNNNASELCHDDFFFVLWDAHRNEPKRDVIVAALGEPASREKVNLGRYSDVEIFFYPPQHLREKIVEPSIRAAQKLFPSFKCP